MRIGGFQKFSLIDYPKKVAAVVFTQGCDFRCPFCHNPDLVLPDQYLDHLSEEDILAFLEKRKGQLGAVVVTGGEPTIHNDLPDFLMKVKKLGYVVKLDTNGHNPDALKRLLDAKLVDYIAMDIKAPLARYQEATGIKVNVENIQKSINLIIASGIDYHFRTTLVHKFISDNDLEDISKLAGKAKSHWIQKFDTKSKLLDESLKDGRVYSEDEFKKLQKRWEKK